MSVLKEIMVKYIKVARAGKDCKLDLRVGILHAYPNGELIFESGDESKLDHVIMEQRFQARTLKDAEDPIQIADK
jgi:hypothetical protein